ncbi:hypothetical protein [Lacrimispora sp.]|uniref:hypothetical protein n=1 Tax=Lacrimispora sp. TaxID=2719234 RepID=UPI003990F36B
MTTASSTNTAGAFTITPGGQVSIETPGVYLVDGRVQIQGDSGAVSLQINNGGIEPEYSGAFLTNITDISGLIVINAILDLNEGDTVSLINASTTLTLTLLSAIIGAATPSATIRLVRLYET